MKKVDAVEKSKLRKAVPYVIAAIILVIHVALFLAAMPHSQTLYPGEVSNY